MWIDVNRSIYSYQNQTVYLSNAQRQKSPSIRENVCNTWAVPKSLIDSRVGRMCLRTACTLLAPLRIFLTRDIGYARIARHLPDGDFGLCRFVWPPGYWTIHDGFLLEHNLIRTHDFFYGKPQRFTPNLSSISVTWFLQSRLVSQIITYYIYLYLIIRNYCIVTSSARTRRGGSCLKDIYKTFLIYRTCMRRAPAKPVRACILQKWGPVSHVTFEAPLRTSHFSLHSSHSTLHASHSTLHTSHCTLRTPHFTLHTSQSTLHTSHFTLHTSHSTLHTPHFTLHSSRPTLLTPHCFLHTHNFTLHTSHCTQSRPTLHTALFTLHTSSHLSPSHLIPAHLFSSLLICHLSFHESLPSTTTNHCRSLDAPTPIRFTIFSCKRQEYYVCSRGTKQPWRSHSNAICRDWAAKHNRITRNGIGNCSSKTGDLDAKAKKKTILKHFLKGFLKGKSLAPKWRKSSDKAISQPGCSHSNTIYDLQLQKTIVLPMQPLHQATLTQPLQCDLQRLSCKTQ